jgi:serine/threonine protein kinase
MLSSLNGLVINGRFHLVNKIGEGSFGEVYCGIDKKNGKEIAVKTESTKAEFPQIAYESFVI